MKRVKDQSPSSQTPETPPRLCWLIPGLTLRFDAFDFTKFYEDVTTRTLSHTLSAVSYQQPVHPAFAALDDGEGLVERKRKYEGKTSRKKTGTWRCRGNRLICSLLWVGTVKLVFFGLQKWVVLSCFLYFCAIKFAFCATVAFKVFFWYIMWTGRVVVGTWKRRQILKATSQKIKAKV